MSSTLVVPRALVRGHLFDADGTLIYSDGPLKLAWETWARERAGITDPQAIEGTLVASRGKKVAPFMAEYVTEHGSRSAKDRLSTDAALDAEAKTWFDSQVAPAVEGRDGTVAITGGAPLVNAIRNRVRKERVFEVDPAQRLGLMIYSSTVPDVLLPRLEHTGFDVTAEDFMDVRIVEKGKPNPQGYVLSAEAIDVPIENCIVYEDARSGLVAGRESGAYVVGLRTTDESEAVLWTNSDVIVDSIGDVALGRGGEVRFNNPTLVPDSRLAVDLTSLDRSAGRDAAGL